MDDKYIVDVKAVADLMPPKPDTLRVTVTIKANEGQTATLKPAVSQGINPTILLLEVDVKGRGAEPTEMEVAYEDREYDDRYEKVTVSYMSEKETVDIAKVH